MNSIQQAIVWFRRIFHCRGFGIQSPTDYSFVREVVNERSPYYAYSEVGLGDTWLRRKMGRLCLRLANHQQPDVIVDLAGYADYLSAGCRRAVITHDVAAAHGTVLVVASADSIDDELLAACLPGAMLMVEDTGLHSKQWQTVLQQPQATITFDLYYCGIAIFDPQRAKQHYIVNF